MALEIPLKKELDLAAKQIDNLNREYNKYFQGAEEEPPRDMRKELDHLIQTIKSALATTANATVKFSANALISKYRTHAAKWDRILKLLEEGKMTRPKKRE
jgi:hypothetical protein